MLVPGILQSSLYKCAWSHTWARGTKPLFKMIFCYPKVKFCLQQAQWKLRYWSQWGQTLFLLRYSEFWKQFRLGKKVGTGDKLLFDLFLLEILTETIGSFLPVPPNTYQIMYFLWVIINFITWHFILQWETGFQEVWFMGHVYLGRSCLLFSLLYNSKQRALKGYIKI